MGTIVVGIDGSSTSWDALAWATGEAVLRGASLEIIHAWELPPAAAVYASPGAALEMNAAEVLTEAANRVERQLGSDHEVEVTTVAPCSATAPALIHASDHADLLVLGSRGHGAFVGMLLGSVSLHCASHAHCPVVIVHPDE